jgi:hypothetical protein
MTAKRDARALLERRLGELGLVDEGGGAPGPALSRRPSLALRAAELLALRDERRDPLTGHRGVVEGVEVLCRTRDWIVDLQLRHEPDGAVLRAQLVPVVEPSELSPGGSLLHVTSDERSQLGCVDRHGEVVIRGLPAAPVRRVLLELDDEVVQLPWPEETPAR